MIKELKIDSIENQNQLFNRIINKYDLSEDEMLDIHFYNDDYFSSFELKWNELVELCDWVNVNDIERMILTTNHLFNNQTTLKVKYEIGDGDGFILGNDDFNLPHIFTMIELDDFEYNLDND